MTGFTVARPLDSAAIESSWRAYLAAGGTEDGPYVPSAITKAAKEPGRNHATLRRHVELKLRWRDTPEHIAEAARAGGIADPADLRHFWKIAKGEDGNGFSLFVKNPQSGEEIDFRALIEETVAEIRDFVPPALPARPPPQGEHLAVIDPADVHFNKLAVATETGYTYDRDVATHRVIEGTRGILETIRPMGVDRILFVLGNDALHIDTAKKTTTSGTLQDTEGSPFQAFRDGQVAFNRAISMCADLAPVDLVYCPANHDWLLGFAMAQTIAALATRDPRVTATPYNMSERHRKYYRYERNLLGLSHGDGAKEEALVGLMLREARAHISECTHLYWYLHHLHHKIRRRRGAEKALLTEKDHPSITSVVRGAERVEAEGVDIEYVRSPSAPDGWHDRNGYVNRQAVEVFLHHAHDGQVHRFTKWF